MSFPTASTFRYSLRRTAAAAAADQSLHIRLRFFWHFLSRSPSVGLPYEILKEIPSSSIRETTFALPLRQLEDSQFCEVYVAQLISSLDLGVVTSGIIARKITLIVVEVLAEGNYDTKFQIAAEIDHIQMFWEEKEERSLVPVVNGERRGVVVEERVVLEEAPARIMAAERESKRFKTERFDEFEGGELGDCCVCCEELKDEMKEVSKIRCGHVYHKSCILNWVQRRNSCPLCRSEIVFEV